MPDPRPARRLPRPGLTPGTVTRCNDCGAPIRLATTHANRKLQAVNAAPDEAGNLACWWADGVLWARQLSTARPGREIGEWPGRPHISTCPAKRRPQPRLNGDRHRQGVRPIRQQRQP